MITMHISQGKLFQIIHCKNRNVKIANLLVSTFTRNRGIYNLIGCVGCYYNPIIAYFNYPYTVY